MSMNMKLIHFYPDLMNLYGSYANLLVLRRLLEELGCTVTLVTVQPGEDADLSDADFLFMGAGTERRQKTALEDLTRYRDQLRAAMDRGVCALFCGTAMELLGKTLTDAEGKQYPCLGLGEFSTVQKNTRITEDVLGTTDLFPDPVVGFMNKCSILTGVRFPLMTSTQLGVGNEGPGSPEGFHKKNFFGSELTGPLLVKNPRLLGAVVKAIGIRRGLPMPVKRPTDAWAEDGYTITVEELKKRQK